MSHNNLNLFDIGCVARDYFLQDETSLVNLLQEAYAGGFSEVLFLPSEKLDLTEPEFLLNLDSRHEFKLAKPYFAANLFKIKNNNLEINEIGKLKDLGAKAFYVDLSQNIRLDILREAFEYASNFGLVIICDINSNSGSVAEGLVSTKLGLHGIPEVVETNWVYKLIELSNLCDVKIHIRKISCAKSCDLICEAKINKINITASVASWHLIYDENILLERKFDSNYKFSPPLRKIKDRERLINAVNNQEICVEPDHNPVVPHMKEEAFEYADFGRKNYETCLSNLFEKLDNIISKDKILQALGGVARNSVIPEY